jgi:hypothetical protein
MEGKKPEQKKAHPHMRSKNDKKNDGKWVHTNQIKTKKVDSLNKK